MFAFVTVLCFRFIGVFLFILNKAGGQGDDTHRRRIMPSVSALADYNILAYLPCAESQTLSCGHEDSVPQLIFGGCSLCTDRATFCCTFAYKLLLLCTIHVLALGMII